MIYIYTSKFCTLKKLYHYHLYIFTQHYVNVLGCVNVNAKVIHEVTMSSGLLSPPKPSFSDIHKVRF
jgi:hypothetical protein